MRTTDEELAEMICGFAVAFHGDGGPSSGRSLLDLVEHSGYLELRPRLSRGLLARYLRHRPELVHHWLRYSEDKRTSSGWYLQAGTAGWTLGRVASPGVSPKEERFDSGPEACAEFILRELDDIAG